METEERIHPVRFREMVIGSRFRWERAIERVPGDRWDDPTAPGNGTIKDLIAHIAWYEAQLMSLLLTRDFSQGSGLWFVEPDERNAAIYAERAHWTRERVVQEEQELFEALRPLLAELDEVDLNEPSQFVGMPDDLVPWEVIAGNTFGHYDEHLPDLEDWLDRRI
ncbi:hypothetical protein BH09CHL1_BH09CHL1_16210 [soil metagenome]